MASPWKVRATGDAPGGMVADAGELRRGLELLADPGGFCQIVALPTARCSTLAGSDLDGLCIAAESMPDGGGVYLEINPVKAGLVSKAKAADVVRRRWLFIDVDPLRAAGFEKQAATDQEKADAGEAAQEVFDYLTLAGWPTPAVMDSGNGWYLLYRIDLPNDDDARRLVRAVLYHLAELVRDRACSFDKSVHNADRVARLPGTWNRKGDNTPDRPHRIARIVGMPAALGVVTAEQMRAAVPTNADRPGVGVSRWNLRAAGPGDRPYALAAMEGERVKLAFAPVGGRNSQLYKSAAALGEFVGAGCLTDAEVIESLTAAAGENGLLTEDGATLVRDTIRRAVEKGSQNPRKIPDRGAPVSPSSQVTPVAGNSRWRLAAAGKSNGERQTLYTLPDLLALELPDPRWAVPGLLSEGLTILAGKPKLGKSWMALNLAMTIAAGGKALGSVQVQAGDVLYLALEDRVRRIRDRAAKVLKGLGVRPPGRLSFAVEWPRQDQGGTDRLAEWLEAASDPRLVVIDVWAKYRSPAKTRGSAYEQDYDQLTEVKSCADHYGASVVAVHHTRKGAAEDVFDEISGTLGIAGAADGSLVLARSRGENEGTLAMTGRDIEEQVLAVEFDPTTFCWKSHGPAEKRFTGKLQTEVVDYLKGHGLPKFLSEICDHFKKTDRNEKESLRTVLNRLVDAHVLRRHGNAYAWPGDGSGVEGTTDEVPE